MNAFNQLSQKDQMEIAVYIGQQVLALVTLGVVMITAVLVFCECSVTPIKYGWIMAWTCSCASSFIGHPGNRIFWIYVLGIVIPLLAPTVWRYLWPKLVQKWRTR